MTQPTGMPLTVTELRASSVRAVRHAAPPRRRYLAGPMLLLAGVIMGAAVSARYPPDMLDSPTSVGTPAGRCVWEPR